MKSILFTYHPSFVRFNHGATLLTAICKKEGIKANYFPLIKNFQLMKSRIKDFDVIGFSFVCEFDYANCKPFIQMARDTGKQVIAGGGYCRKGGKVDGIDLVCRGEAEDFIVDFLNGNDGAFKVGYVRPSIDGLPMPDLTNITGYEFHRDQDFLMGLKIIPYQTSRGCFWGKCSFCEVQFQPGKKVRIKHTIAGDIKFLVETYKPDLIYLMDTTIPYCFPEWREQFEKVNTPFQGYIRADADPSDLEFLCKHGLKFTAFGVESPYEDFRNNSLKKGVSNVQLFETVKILKKYGVNYVAFFINQNPLDEKEINDIEKFSNTIGGSHITWEKGDVSKSIDIQI